MHSGRPTVLVVDDDRDTRFEFASWLTDAGYRCVTAEDAPTALWFARRLSPEAAVVDVGPDQQGLRLASSLGYDGSMAGVVLATPADARRRSTVLPRGASHVAKPADSGALIAAVQRASELRHEAETTSRGRRDELAALVAQRQRTLGDAIATARTADEALETLREAFGDRSPALFAHARRVAHTAGVLAGTLFLSAPDADTVVGAALLHDIGKLTLPAEVLLGEVNLGDAEVSALGNHHARTLALIDRAPALMTVAPVVEYVHARWDGAGVPYGVGGQDIPLAARIIATANALDEARGREGSPEARATAICRLAGSRLDPDLVRVCLHTLDASPCS